LVEDTSMWAVFALFELIVFARRRAARDRPMLPLNPLRMSGHHMAYGVLRTTV
jgi:hypothetical protein